MHDFVVRLHCNGVKPAAVLHELGQRCASHLEAKGATSLSVQPGRVRWCGSLAALTRTKGGTGNVIALACDENDSGWTLAALQSALSVATWSSALVRAGCPAASAFKVKIKADRALLVRLSLSVTDVTELVASTVVEARPAWRAVLSTSKADAILDVELRADGFVAGVVVRDAAGAGGEGSSHAANEPQRLRQRVVSTPASVPRWLRDARREKVIAFDSSRYRLVELVADLLGVPAVDLGRLHLLKLADVRWPMHPKLAKAYKLAGVHVPPEAMASSFGDQALASDPRHQNFLRAFRLLAAEVVAPNMLLRRDAAAAEVPHDGGGGGCGGGCGGGGGCGDGDGSSGGESPRILCQLPPTLRISLPGAPPTISLHSDAVYPHHHPCEVNWWLPLTRVYGSNTLWIESTPGASDYKPVELCPGQLLRCNGYECRHYTMPNATEHSRVSFDFRAVPEELAAGEGGQPSMRCGEFPVELIAISSRVEVELA